MSSLSSSDGARGLRETAPAAAAALETHGSSFRPRFNSLTLDQLSDELDRRTKETQRLQEEVENATKVALERFGGKYGINTSPGQSCHSHWFNFYNPPGDFTISPTTTLAGTQPLDCDLDIINKEVAQRQISSPEKRVLENALNDGFQQTHDQTEPETFSVDKAIENLQTKLNKVQMEKDVLSDLRLKDSRNHVDQMEKMLCMLEELQNIKRATDQKLQDTEDEAVALSRKVETLEQIMKETYSTLLCHESRCDKDHGTNLNAPTRSGPPSPAAKLTEDTNDTNVLQERCLRSVEHLWREEHSGGNMQKQRSKELIASLCQEMALLTNKLSSSKQNSVSLSVKLELLKNLTERHTSLHQCQIGDLESDISSHKDKVCCLEQQLLQVQSQLADAQREKERALHQREELQFQLSQLKRYSEQQQHELHVEVKALRGGLEEARELHRVAEENNCLQSLQDLRTQEGRTAQELLREKDEELQLRLQEAQQHYSWSQTLHTEGETLRRKLEDREKLIDNLQLQLESIKQMKAQHSHTINNFHHENNLLSNQLNQHKLQIQQLRAELDQHKSDLATAEHERRNLQASVAEQGQRLREETLEKRQLSSQLEIQRLQLLALTKEHEEQQRLHSCRSDEREGVVLRLRSQLRDTQDELDQVRITLRTLEGADGHGLRVALDMQQEITDRREQVDSLQSKIQHLEETVEKLHQEKRHQSLENQRQLGQLAFVREEKKLLSRELEALGSKDQQLRDRIGQLETILHKMSESFADCQEFIQLQEQQFYRLKLGHALDLKELQGQNLHSTLNPTPPDPDSPNPSELRAPPSSQHASSALIKESPARQLRSLVKELRGVISENHRPHTDNSPAGRSFHRRRSAPEREHRTTFSTEEVEKVKANSRSRRETCSREQLFLPKAQLNGKMIHKDSFREKIMAHPGRLASSPATAARFTSPQQLLSLGRRSPVHSLLTSDPHS
ncbi:coiled-coil domain-containing protein 158-like isoform X2 [Platichthys flesus]|uniref:coiled-coil domain-containing protein 158-like isoform X2 n=1 Tax=Platichthys flesus TaxID=8260 RepID=UPI002DB8E93F|nr:coiled-coil domain-containing protein 158-like isoform X2 [Platichthys flesus]